MVSLVPTELRDVVPCEECISEVRGWIAAIEVEDLKSVVRSHGHIFAVRRNADRIYASGPGNGEERHVVYIAGSGEFAVRI